MRLVKFSEKPQWGNSMAKGTERYLKRPSCCRLSQFYMRCVLLVIIFVPAAFLSFRFFVRREKPPQLAYSDIDESQTASIWVRPPHISPNIWQIYLTYDLAAAPKDNLYTWISLSPSYAYTMVDGQAADTLISKFSQRDKYSNVRTLFNRMTRRVMRADFLRYLLLATEGGIYTDIDTKLVRPIDEWVPDEYKNQTRLIVALEVDQSPPAQGTTYEVQFCQWTLAAAPDHPVLWTMIDRILGQVQDMTSTQGHTNFTDQEVLNVTGPVGWTEVIYDHLSSITGTPMTWRNLTGIKHPILFDDILILPLDAFRESLVIHLFSGSWKQGWI